MTITIAERNWSGFVKFRTCRALWLSTFALVDGCFEDFIPPAYDYAQEVDAGRDGGSSEVALGNGAGDSSSGDYSQSTSDASGGGGGDASTSDADFPPPSDECDLTGRWVATFHKAVTAFGAKQAIHNVVYYEITKQGDTFQISKGIYCGDDVICPPLQLIYDTNALRAAMREKKDVTTRTVASTKSASGCDVHFGKWSTVLGLTKDYLDFNVAMPTADQKASNGQPGWEDWDNDTHPGITINVTSSVARGQLYSISRDWNEISGTVPDVRVDKIRLSVKWDQEQVALGYDGPALLALSASLLGDPTQDFVELHRLHADQAAGDDEAICNNLFDLVSTLTPDAYGYGL